MLDLVLATLAGESTKDLKALSNRQMAAIT
jgi:hypothetical protein